MQRQEYSDIILAFPDLSRPPGLPKLVKHDTVYRIRTTPGPALFHQSRLVATEKLKIAKDKSDQMLQMRV